MRRWTLFSAFVLSLTMVAPGTGSAGPSDRALVAMTILPPGTDAAHAIAEIAPYDDLARGYRTLTADTLPRYFKNAGFGTQGTIARDYSPRPGVRILRDEQWGVPHVYGQTDADTWFGSGYVSAEDRLPIMDLLRVLGRGEAFEMLGTTPAWLADAEMARLYGYTEQELQEQLARLPKLYGAEGEEALTAIREFVAGVNLYIKRIDEGQAPLPDGYKELGKLPQPWRETDVVAVAGVIRAEFGADGGNELANQVTLANMLADFGPAEGRAIYEDFRNRDNRDGPMQASGTYPYMERTEAALDPAANLQVNYSSGKSGIQQTVENVADGNGQYSRTAPPVASMAELTQLADRARIHWDRLQLDTPLGSVNLKPHGLSNALVVGASRAADGHPILLGGPQTGYFSPEILLEEDLHGPTIDARGAAFPGVSMFILLGRGTASSWTATAGGGDMIDTVIERLCEPSGAPATEHSYGYRYKGRCEPMDRRVLATLPHLPDDGGYRALPDIYAERTIHGTVLARGTVGGEPVAVVRQRSSYGKEVDSAVAFLRLNRNEVHSGADFVRVMADVNLSTNWLYAGPEDIAYQYGGLYPIRPAAVDPDLPVWGTGEWDWQGYLTHDQMPHEINPATGYLVSWNNRPAPGWGAADSKWNWSALYRASMLADRIEAETDITPVRLVQMMEDAGLSDFIGTHDLPLILRVLQAGASPGPRETQMISILESWLADGAQRIDADGDGRYEHADAIAIMDQWWTTLTTAMYAPVIGSVGRIPGGIDNAPSLIGSAYQDGFYGQVKTDLSMLLGDPVASPTHRAYCGGTAQAAATLASCASALWTSLTRAGDALASSQGSEDPTAWSVDPEIERIRFLPGIALSMAWVNRPTFQQLTQFGD